MPERRVPPPLSVSVLAETPQPTSQRAHAANVRTEGAARQWNAALIGRRRLVGAMGIYLKLDWAGQGGMSVCWKYSGGRRRGRSQRSHRGCHGL